MAKSKIPDSLFVVVKKIEDYEYIKDANGNWGKGPSTFSNFGFLHANDGNLKKRKTQMDWAYDADPQMDEDGNWWHTVYRIENGMYVLDQNGHYGNGHYGRKVDRVKIEPEYAPRVWDNVPLSNFTIIDTVNRYRGNKLFKVLDPRGVEFEVTVKSLFVIIQEAIIINGVIQNKCVWKTNKDLVVVK
jgi:hypothetical protein